MSPEKSSKKNSGLILNEKMKLENDSQKRGEPMNNEIVEYNGNRSMDVVQRDDDDINVVQRDDDDIDVVQMDKDRQDLRNLISKCVEVMPASTNVDFYMKCGTARYIPDTDNSWEITFYGNAQLLDYYKNSMKNLNSIDSTAMQGQKSYTIKDVCKDEKEGNITVTLQIHWERIHKTRQIIHKICYGFELLSNWYLTQQASFQHITRWQCCILPMTIYPKVINIYPLLFTRDYEFATIQGILHVCSSLICASIEGMDVVRIIRQRKEHLKWKEDIFYRFHDLFLDQNGGILPNSTEKKVENPAIQNDSSQIQVSNKDITPYDAGNLRLEEPNKTVSGDAYKVPTNESPKSNGAKSLEKDPAIQNDSSQIKVSNGDDTPNNAGNLSLEEPNKTVNNNMHKVSTMRSPKNNGVKSAEKELRNILITSPEYQHEENANPSPTKSRSRSNSMNTPRSKSITRSRSNSITRSRSNSINTPRSSLEKRKFNKSNGVKMVSSTARYLINELNELNMNNSTYSSVKKVFLKRPRPRKKKGLSSKVFKELQIVMKSSKLAPRDRKRKKAIHTKNIYDEIGQPYQLVCGKKRYYKKYREEYGIKDKETTIANTETTEKTEEEIYNCICQKNHRKVEESFYVQCDTCDHWHCVLEKCVHFSEEDAKKFETWKCWECVKNEKINTLNFCICGKYHKNMGFYQKCDDCNVWYKLAEKCIGFTKEEAEDFKEWICWNCKVSTCVCGKKHEDKGDLFKLKCNGCETKYLVAEKCVGFNKDYSQKNKHWECLSCLYPGINKNKLAEFSTKSFKRRKLSGSEENEKSDLSSILSLNITKIQTLYRGYKIRVRFREEKIVLSLWKSMLLLQNVAKAWSCRIRFLKFKKCTIFFQSLVRRYLARKQYLLITQRSSQASFVQHHTLRNEKTLDGPSQTSRHDSSSSSEEDTVCKQNNSEFNEESISLEEGENFVDALDTLSLSNNSEYHTKKRSVETRNIEVDHVIFSVNKDSTNKTASQEKNVKSSKNCKFRNSGCYLNDVNKWRPHFTYDKKRHIGNFLSQAEAEAALQIVRDKLSKSDTYGEDAIQEAIRLANVRVKNGTSSIQLSSSRDTKSTVTHATTKTKSCNNYNEGSEKTYVSHFLLPQLNEVSIDDASYLSILLNIQSRQDIKKIPKKGLLKELETAMTGSAMKAKNKKRQQVKHSEDIYLQIGQPYQILTSNKKLFYPGKQRQQDKQVAKENNTNIFGCLCSENHQGRDNSFYIQCDTCETWYCVTEGCLGFSQDHADGLDHWNCWKCPCMDEKKRKVYQVSTSQSKKGKFVDVTDGVKSCVLASSALNPALSKYVMLIQAIYRGHKIRKKIREEKHILSSWKSILLLQRVTRMWISRKRMKALVSAIITVQKYVKMYQAKRRYRKILKAIISLQNRWKMMMDTDYSNHVNTYFSNVLCCPFRKMRLSAIIIQRKWRRWNFSVKISRWYYILNIVRIKMTVSKIQSFWRRYIVRVRYNAAILIQSACRMFSTRSHFRKRKKATIRIQKTWRYSCSKKTFRGYRKQIFELHTDALNRKRCTTPSSVFKFVADKSKRVFDISNPVVEMIRNTSNPGRVSSRIKYNVSNQSNSLPIGEFRICSKNSLHNHDDGSYASLDQQKIEINWLVPKENKFTRKKFGNAINRSKDDVTPLPRVLRVKHHTLLLYTKSVIKSGYFKSGLFAYYIGESRNFRLNQDLDIGIYAHPHKKTSKLIMDVKSFLYNHTAMAYGHRYHFQGEEDVFLDVTDDSTGDLMTQAKTNLLAYAKELTQDKITRSKLKLKTHLRAAYDSNGSLHYILSKGNHFTKDQEYELFVSFESLSKNANVSCCNNFGSVYSSSANKSTRVEGCHLCLDLEGKNDEKVPGYLKLRKQLGSLLEEEVEEILDFFLENPPECAQARFRMRWLANQLQVYCKELLFFCANVPRKYMTKICRVFELFPRKDGHKEQDEKYMIENQYIGTFVRVNFRDGIASGLVEDRINTRSSKDGKYLVKCFDTELIFLNQEEIEKCCFRPRFGHLCTLR